MTRPRKQTVDYFPHYCHHGKTMRILEQKYGNNGYAFWFKILELLGSSEGHYINCNDLTAWEYLQSISLLEENICFEILDLLARVQAIDAELWASKIIWSDNFVQGITQAYRNRTSDIPKRPDFLRQKPLSKEDNGVNQAKISATRKEVNKIEVNNTLVSPNRGNGVEDEFEIWWKAYPQRRKQGKPVAKTKFIHLRKMGKLPPLTNLLKTLEAQKQSLDWLKEGGDYIPGPIPYLNGGKYVDESVGDFKDKPIYNHPNPSCPKCHGKGMYPKKGGPGQILCDCRKVEKCPDHPVK